MPDTQNINNDNKGKSKLTPEQLKLQLERKQLKKEQRRKRKEEIRSQLGWNPAAENRSSDVSTKVSTTSQNSNPTEAGASTSTSSSTSTTPFKVSDNITLDEVAEQLPQDTTKLEIKEALVNLIVEHLKPLNSSSDTKIPKIVFHNKLDVTDKNNEFYNLLVKKFDEDRVEMINRQDGLLDFNKEAKNQTYVNQVALRLLSYQQTTIELIDEKIDSKIQKNEKDQEKLEKEREKLKERVNAFGNYLQTEIKNLKNKIQTPIELLNIALSEFVDIITTLNTDKSEEELKKSIQVLLQSERYHIWAAKQQQGGRETIVTVSKTEDGNYRVQIDKPSPNHITEAQYDELSRIFNTHERKIAAVTELKKIFESHEEKFNVDEKDKLNKIFKTKPETLKTDEFEEIKRCFKKEREKLSKASFDPKQHLLQLESRPLWFEDKLPAIQAKLKRILGNETQDAIKSYEDVVKVYITQPSSMKDIPGIHNYGKSEVTLVKFKESSVNGENKLEKQILFRDVEDRSSSFYPEGIKNKEEGYRICKLNVEQHLDKMEQYVKDYHDMWGLSSDKQVHMQLIMMTLVTPFKDEKYIVSKRTLATYESLGLDKEGNPAKTVDDSKAVLRQKINKIKETYQNLRLDILNPNFALNAMRFAYNPPKDNEKCADGLLAEIESIAQHFPEGEIKIAVTTFIEAGKQGNSDAMFAKLKTLQNDERKKLIEAFTNGTFKKSEKYTPEARATQFSLKVEAAAHYISLVKQKNHAKNLYNLYKGVNLYKAAYLALSEGRVPSQQDVIDAFNAVIMGCKSGKDRTGILLIFICAMREYKEKNQQLPNFNDEGKERKALIKIFGDVLFKNHHLIVVSLLNALGTEGFKAVFDWFPKDFQAEITRRLPHFIKQNNRLGDLNKPEPKYGKIKKYGINSIIKPVNTVFVSKERANAIDYFRRETLKAVEGKDFKSIANDDKQYNKLKNQVKIPRLSDVESIIDFHIQSLHRYIRQTIHKDKVYTVTQDKKLGPLVRYLSLLENKDKIDPKISLYALLTSGHPGAEQYRKQLQMPEHVEALSKLLRNDFRQQLNLDEPQNYQEREEFNKRIQAIVDLANQVETNDQKKKPEKNPKSDDPHKDQDNVDRAEEKQPKVAQEQENQNAKLANEPQNNMKKIKTFDDNIKDIITKHVVHYLFNEDNTMKDAFKYAFNKLFPSQKFDTKEAVNGFFENNLFVGKMVLYILLADNNKEFQKYLEKKFAEEFKDELTNKFRGKNSAFPTHSVHAANVQYLTAKVQYLKEALAQDFRSQINEYVITKDKKHKYPVVREDIFNDIVLESIARGIHGKEPKMNFANGTNTINTMEELLDTAHVKAIEFYVVKNDKTEEIKISEEILNHMIDYFDQSKKMQTMPQKSLRDIITNQKDNTFIPKVVLYALLADNNKEFQKYLEKKFGNQSEKAANLKYLKEALAQEFRSEINNYVKDYKDKYDHIRENIFNDIVIQSLVDGFHGKKTLMTDVNFNGIKNMEMLVNKASDISNIIGIVKGYFDQKQQQKNFCGFKLFPSKQQPNVQNFGSDFKDSNPFIQKVVLYALLTDKDKDLQKYVENQLKNQYGQNGKTHIEYLKATLAEEFAPALKNKGDKKNFDNIIKMLLDSYHKKEAVTPLKDCLNINNMDLLLKMASTKAATQAAKTTAENLEAVHGSSSLPKPTA